MDLRAIECFLAVADEGTFSRAAERLRMTQPSVSQQVRKLETEVKTLLFERGSRGVSLTAAGSALLPAARRILAAAGEFQTAATERAGQLSGSLSLGVVDGLEHTGFPAALGVLRNRHPLLELQLRDGTSGALLERLVDRSLDAVVIAQPPRALPEFAETLLLLEEELIMIRVRQDGVTEKARVALKDVAPELTISYPPESGVRALIHHAAREVGAQVRFPYTTNDASLHVALARAGLGAALTVGSVDTFAAASREAVSFFDPPIRLRKILVWIREPRPSRGVRELVSAFKAVDLSTH